jgi:uncharacterized membrane protein
VQVLPSDLVVPDVPYLVGLLVAAGIVGAVIYRRRPPVTEETATAFAPWMAAGGTLYALYQAGVLPPEIAPLFSSPTVYVTLGILAVGIWGAVADRPASTWDPTSMPGVLATTGSALLVAALAVAALLGVGPTTRGASPLLLSGIVLVSLVVTVVTWVGLRRVYDVSATETVGLVVVFGHAIDGVSTAVGHDLLGFGEQTPISRVILEAGSSLPTAELIGGGWLFVVVKLALAAAVVAAFQAYVRDEPTEGYLLLGLLAAVGLGPGVHNVVLFALG